MIDMIALVAKADKQVYACREDISIYMYKDINNKQQNPINGVLVADERQR